MKDRDQSRLASGLAILLGIWVAISPIWISTPGGALTSVIITGCVIAAMGIVQYFTENSIPSWLMGLAAIWLFITAFAFGLASGTIWNLALSAIATFILATWDGVETEEVRQHHHAPLS